MKTHKKNIIITALIMIFCSSCGDDKSIKGLFYSSMRQFKDDKSVTAALEEKIRIAEKEKGAKKELRSGSDLADLHDQLGNRYLEESNWSGSIEQLKKSVELGNKTPAVYYSLGLAYSNRGKESGVEEDLAQAEHHLLHSLELRSADNMAAYALAILLFYHRDQKKKGLALMETFVSNNKKFYRGRFALARMYYDVKQPEKSLALYVDLQSELDTLPDSDMVREYKTACRNNIRIISEGQSPEKE